MQLVAHPDDLRSLLQVELKPASMPPDEPPIEPASMPPPLPPANSRSPAGEADLPPHAAADSRSTNPNERAPLAAEPRFTL